MIDASSLKQLFDSFAGSAVYPFVIMDLKGKLLSFNEKAETLFAIKEGNDSFADLFLISEGLKLKSLLIPETKTDFSDTVTLYLRNGKEITVSYAVQSPEVAGEKYLFFQFRESSQRGVNHFNLNVTRKEMKDLGIQDELSTFLGEIESSYPFTYLAKNKLQTKANQFSEMIWLKDSEGKYVLVNDKFSNHLNLKPGQMEGRAEKNFIPNFINDFYTALEKYLKESLSIAILTSDKVKGIAVDTPHEIIEIPLLDLDDNLVAIVGVARPSDEKKLLGGKDSENNLIFTDDINFNLETILKLKNKMYEFIISKNPDAIFIYDLESFKFLDVNDAALSIYGYSRQEFLQMDLTDLYLPEEIQTIAESAKNEEGRFVGPFNHRKKDGSLIQVEICKIAFTYEGAEAHFNIVRDITKILEIEEQLQMMRTVFEYSQDILIVTDNTGFINYINPAVEKHLGFRRTDLLNNSIISLASESSRADFLKKSETPYNFSATIKNSSKADVAVEVTSVAFAGIDGEVSQVAYIGRIADAVSEPKEVVVEKEVEKIVYVDKPVEKIVYVEKQTQGNHEIKAGGIDPGQLSFIFHEILTPINVIVGFISELKDTLETPSEEQEEAIGYIDENRKKLLYTMDSISEYAQIEQHFGDITKTQFNLDELVLKVFKEMHDSQSPWKKEIVHDRISMGVQINSDQEKVLNIVCLILKIISHVTDEREIIISAYQLDDANFIVTFRDHHLKIQQKLLYIIQNLFSEQDVSKLRAFGVSRFTIFSAQRLFTLLNGRFEIVQKSGLPFEIGLILPINAEFVSETEAVEEQKENIFRPAITAEKVNSLRASAEYADTSARSNPIENVSGSQYDYLMPKQEPPAKSVEKEKSEYIDFDFDSELDFLSRRKKREADRRESERTETRNFRRSFEEPPLQREELREPARRSDSSFDFDSGFSRSDYSEKKPAKPVQTSYPDTSSREVTPQKPPLREEPTSVPKEPVRTYSPTPAPEPPESRSASVAKVTENREPSSIDLRNMSCLYIEDQLDSQILFKVQMKELKSIKFSQSFEDAIPLLENEKFDFIVLDINLQGEYNGLDALKVIRTMEGLELIPIIAVTAYVLPGDKEKFIATGFTDFVSKPIFRNKLVEVLSKIF